MEVKEKLKDRNITLRSHFLGWKNWGLPAKAYHTKKDKVDPAKPSDNNPNQENDIKIYKKQVLVIFYYFEFLAFSSYNFIILLSYFIYSNNTTRIWTNKKMHN